MTNLSHWIDLKTHQHFNLSTTLLTQWFKGSDPIIFLNLFCGSVSVGRMDMKSLY